MWGQDLEYIVEDDDEEEYGHKMSRKRRSVSSSSSTSKQSRMSVAAVDDLYRVTGHTNFESLIDHLSNLQKPRWILETSAAGLPEAEYIMIDRLLEIGRGFTCQNSVLVLTHCLLTLAVHSVRLQRNTTQSFRLPYAVRFEPKENAVSTIPGAKRKIGDDVILRVPTELYDVDSTVLLNVEGVGESSQTQAIVNKFSEPVVIHEVEFHDHGKLGYKYAYVADQVYQLHNMQNVLVCLTDSTGTTYVIETIRNPPEHKYRFSPNSFDYFCLVHGPSLINPRLDIAEAKRFVQLLSSYLMQAFPTSSEQTGVSDAGVSARARAHPGSSEQTGVSDAGVSARAHPGSSEQIGVSDAGVSARAHPGSSEQTGVSDGGVSS